MKSFAFIVNPITMKQLKSFWPAFRILPEFIIRASLKKFPPFKVLHIKKIQSIQGKEIEGYLIVCPLLHQRLSDLEEDFILDKILEAGYIAERLGAKVLGLDGYTSVVADKRYNTITRNLKIPVTSGNAFTAWSIFEAVYRLTRLKNIDLKKSTLAVIGAADSIGSLCSRKLSDYVPKIIISAKHRDKLERLKETILHLNPVEVIIEEDAHRAVKDADIVINANNSSETAFDMEKLKPNTIVCDIFLTDNILDKAKLRQDITVIKGGLIKLPNPDKLGINTGLPKGIITASMAETILLTFEERFISYSLGENINLDKLEEIANISALHGLEVWVPEAPVL